MAQTIGDTLSAVKTILAGVDPSPQPAPTAVYRYPEDAANIKCDGNFPILIVSQAINEPGSYGHATMGEVYHKWPLEVLAVLGPEVMKEGLASQEAEAKARPWLDALAKILLANQSLSSTVDFVGDLTGDKLFDYRIGNLHTYVSTKLYWGIRFLVPLTQRASHPRSA